MAASGRDAESDDDEMIVGKSIENVIKSRGLDYKSWFQMMAPKRGISLSYSFRPAPSNGNGSEIDIFENSPNVKHIEIGRRLHPHYWYNWVYADDKSPPERASVKAMESLKELVVEIRYPFVVLNYDIASQWKELWKDEANKETIRNEIHDVFWLSSKKGHSRRTELCHKFAIVSNVYPMSVSKRDKELLEELGHKPTACISDAAIDLCTLSCMRGFLMSSNWVLRYAGATHNRIGLCYVPLSRRIISEKICSDKNAFYRFFDGRILGNKMTVFVIPVFTGGSHFITLIIRVWISLNDDGKRKLHIDPLVFDSMAQKDSYIDNETTPIKISMFVELIEKTIFEEERLHAGDTTDTSFEKFMSEKLQYNIDTPLSVRSLATKTIQTDGHRCGYYTILFSVVSCVFPFAVIYPIKTMDTLNTTEAWIDKLKDIHLRTYDLMNHETPDEPVRMAFHDYSHSNKEPFMGFIDFAAEQANQVDGSKTMCSERYINLAQDCSVSDDMKRIAENMCVAMNVGDKDIKDAFVELFSIYHSDFSLLGGLDFSDKAREEAAVLFFTYDEQASDSLDDDRVIMHEWPSAWHLFRWPAAFISVYTQLQLAAQERIKKHIDWHTTGLPHGEGTPVNKWGIIHRYNKAHVAYVRGLVHELG